MNLIVGATNSNLFNDDVVSFSGVVCTVRVVGVAQKFEKLERTVGNIRAMTIRNFSKSKLPPMDGNRLQEKSETTDYQKSTTYFQKSHQCHSCCSSPGQAAQNLPLKER